MRDRDLAGVREDDRRILHPAERPEAREDDVHLGIRERAEVRRSRRRATRSTARARSVAASRVTSFRRYETTICVLPERPRTVASRPAAHSKSRTSWATYVVVRRRPLVSEATAVPVVGVREIRRHVQRHLVVPDDRIEALAQVDERVEMPPEVVVDRQRRQRGPHQREPPVVTEPIVASRQVDRHVHRDRGFRPLRERRVQIDRQRRAAARQLPGRAALEPRDRDRVCAAPLHAVRPEAEPDRGQRLRLEVRERDRLDPAPDVAVGVSAEPDLVRRFTGVADDRVRRRARRNGGCDRTRTRGRTGGAGDRASRPGV